MSWGSCLILYGRFGDDEDNFLDLLFNTIRKTIKSHLPEYYEMPYNYFNSEEFEATWSSVSVGQHVKKNSLVSVIKLQLVEQQSYPALGPFLGDGTPDGTRTRDRLSPAF